MTNRRRLARVVALVLTVGLLAGACAANSATTAPPSPDAVAQGTDDTSADDATAAEGEDTTLTDTATPTAPDTDSGTEAAMVELTQAGGRLAAIVDRGILNCGVSDDVIGFSVVQPDGSLQGFDTDWCRALAAAILGDADAVNLVALGAADRFIAIQTGEVDVLMHNTSQTQSRDTDVGMDFGPTIYFDGQQLMGRVGDGFTTTSTIADIGGRTICTTSGTAEANLAAAGDAAGVTITVNAFEDFSLATQNFIDRGCDLLSAAGTSLVGRRVEQQPADQSWVVFPTTPFSKDPLGPIYAPNDSTFADVVNWTIYAAIIADENAVTSANVEAVAADPPTAEIERLLGGEGELQTLMGLDAGALLEVIKQVGNYDELFTRHLAPLGLVRAGSINARWTEGGLVYAPPAQ